MCSLQKFPFRSANKYPKIDRVSSCLWVFVPETNFFHTILYGKSDTSSIETTTVWNANENFVNSDHIKWHLKKIIRKRQAGSLTSDCLVNFDTFFLQLNYWKYGQHSKTVGTAKN